MRLSPDQWVFWQHGFVKLNATIAFTWALMTMLTLGSALLTRKLATGRRLSRWQCLLEIIVTAISKQIEDVGLTRPEKYLGFIGTLFLFVAASSLCTVIPGFQPPTASQLGAIVKARLGLDPRRQKRVAELIELFVDRRDRGAQQELATDQLLNALHLITRQIKPIDRDEVLEALRGQTGVVQSVLRPLTTGEADQ